MAWWCEKEERRVGLAVLGRPVCLYRTFWLVHKLTRVNLLLRTLDKKSGAKIGPQFWKPQTCIALSGNPEIQPCMHGLHITQVLDLHHQWNMSFFGYLEYKYVSNYFSTSISQISFDLERVFLVSIVQLWPIMTLKKSVLEGLRHGQVRLCFKDQARSKWRHVQIISDGTTYK